MLARRRDDLDDVALPQHVTQGDQLAVHLGADRVLTDLGVDRIREVDRRGALRQRLHVALRGEDVDLVREEIDADAVEKLGRILRVLLRLHELAQPQERGVDLVLAGLLFLVEPVRRDAFLGDAVHLPRADLDLHRITLGPDDRRVERLVHVHLGHRDEVFEASGHGFPERVDHAERTVTVAHGAGDHAHGGEIV